jgi:glycerophosphoryl diester phosphodiesterase
MKTLNYIIGIALLLGGACKTIKRDGVSSPAAFPAFSTEAHRGGRGLMPENTIMAMKKAMDLGVTTLEMDTHVTGDNQVVLSHDEYLNPLFTLTPEGKEITKEASRQLILYKMPYETLRKYDVGSKYYSKFPEQLKVKAHIPLLSAVIDSVQQYAKEKGLKQPFYNIETKMGKDADNVLNPEPETFVKLLMEVIRAKKISPYVVIQSFDVRTIQILNKKYPDIRTSYLVDKGNLEDNLKKLGYTPFIYSPAYKLVDAELVRQCHKRNIKVIPWTPNTQAEIAHLKSLGVDGIISDYPNLLVENTLTE